MDAGGPRRRPPSAAGIVDLSWTGATPNGATQVTDTGTTPGTLDTVTGDSGYGRRPPRHDGTMTVALTSTYEPGDQIGALVTLRLGGKPLDDVGRPLATTFVDGGSCTQGRSAHSSRVAALQAPHTKKPRRGARASSWSE